MVRSAQTGTLSAAKMPAKIHNDTENNKRARELALSRQTDKLRAKITIILTVIGIYGAKYPAERNKNTSINKTLKITHFSILSILIAFPKLFFINQINQDSGNGNR